MQHDAQELLRFLLSHLQDVQLSILQGHAQVADTSVSGPEVGVESLPVRSVILPSTPVLTPVPTPSSVSTAPQTEAAELRSPCALMLPQVPMETAAVQGPAPLSTSAGPPSAQRAPDIVLQSEPSSPAPVPETAAPVLVSTPVALDTLQPASALRQSIARRPTLRLEFSPSILHTRRSLECDQADLSPQAARQSPPTKAPPTGPPTASKSSTRSISVPLSSTTASPCAPVSVCPPPTAVDELFGGLLSITTRCMVCESCSVRQEPFMDLSLPVNSDGGRGLVWSLRAFAARSERLHGSNKYHCETCHTLTEADRSIRIQALPKILTLHLNRNSSAHGKV